MGAAEEGFGKAFRRICLEPAPWNVGLFQLLDSGKDGQII